MTAQLLTFTAIMLALVLFTRYEQRNAEAIAEDSRPRTWRSYARPSSSPRETCPNDLSTENRP
jgi:hypothetical protein